MINKDTTIIKHLLNNKTKELNILNKIHYMGEVDENTKIACISSSLLFVLLTEYEGQGIVLLEAMALSKPIIANNLDGTQDIIEHEIDGFRITPNDNEALKKYVKTLINNKELRDKMGQNAKKKAWEKYRWGTTFRSLKKIYLAVKNEK